MAKALPNFQTEDVDIEDAVLNAGSEDITGIIEDIDAQLANVMSEFGGDKHDVKFTIKIYRVVPDRGELAWLFDCVPAELPILSRLRDQYYGGRFETRVYRNNRIFRRIPVLIEAPEKPKEIPVAKNDTAEILRAIADQQAAMHKQLVETLMQVAGKPATPQPSQMDMMMSMVTLMKGMKDIVGSQTPTNQSDPKEYIEVLLRGMEMGRENGGGGSSMTDVLRDAVKALPMLAQMQTPAPVRPRPQTTPPDNSTIKEGPNPEVENVQMNDAMLKHYVGVLVQKAQQNADPTLYADFILDNAPEEIINQYLMREDLIESLSKIDPRVTEHKEWFVELRDHLHEVLTAPDDENDNGPYESTGTEQSTEPPHGTGGDTPNP